MLRVFQFGDVVEKYIDNRGKTPPLSEQGIPLLEVKHLPENRKYPILETSKHVSQEVYDTWFRAHLQAGDILFSTVGTTARVSITPNHPKVAIAQNVLGLRFKSDLLDPLFAFYYLRAKPFQNEVEARLITTVQASIKRSDMVGIPMHLPELSEQKTIASVLGALDDKIENNRRMNETLEEMARAIFKSWFVDFDPVHAKAAGNPPAHMDADTAALFPNSFGDDGLPVGWKKRELGELAENHSTTFDFTDKSDVVFINTGDVLEGRFLHSNRSETKGLPGQAKKSIERGDILYSEIRPKNKRFAYVNLDTTDYVVSTKFMVLRSISDASSLYLYMAMKQPVALMEFNTIAESRSGTFPQITFLSVKHYPLVRPTLDVARKFDDIYDPLFQKQEHISNENQTLAKIRDTLLPKLMSGEIRVTDAKRQVKATA